MIRTDIVTLEFLGDGATKSFDVKIEGIPREPEGQGYFKVERMAVDIENPDEALEGVTTLAYGVDYSYTTVFNARGFAESFTLALVAAVPSGEKIRVTRTTPVIGVSEYPDQGIPPKKAERDFDHIIKILQELGAKFKEFWWWIWWLKDELAWKLDSRNPLPAHAPQHAASGFDPLTPESINALRKAPSTGRPYLAYTTIPPEETPGWLEFVSYSGSVSPTVICQVGYFTADGLSHDFGVIVDHVLGSEYVAVHVYDVATGKRVMFGVRVMDATHVVLHSDVLQRAGREFRVFLFAPGRIDPAWLQGTYQEEFEASTVWTINHYLTTKRPVVIAVDSQGRYIAPSVFDWVNATDSQIVARFAEPTAGSVTVYGWKDGSEVIEVKPKARAFAQSPAAMEWIITHNLGDANPTTLVKNSNGEELYRGIDYHIDYSKTTTSTLAIAFAVPTMGTILIGVR